MNYKGKKVAVLGLGITGKAVVDFLIEKGANITIFDDKAKDDFDKSILNTFSYLNFSLGGDGNLENFDILVVSPGVKPKHRLYKEAQEKNIPIKNDINLFLDEWGNRGPIVGVTGSNGKSTVVSLLFEAIKKTGRKVLLGGNIGISPLTYFKNNIEDGTIIVLELSNYQLELFDENYFVDIAAILNITDNHLDRYDGSISGYADAKNNIVKKGHTKLVTVLDDDGIKKYVLPKMKDVDTYLISLESSVSEADHQGVYTNSSGDLVLKTKDTEIIALDNVKNRNLIGLHNLYNIATVIQIVSLLGIETKEIEKTLREFKGLDHRIQFVKEIDGVKYINDSKSTSPDAMKKALDALALDKEIILITGGDSKGVSYLGLRDYLNQFVKQIILLPGDAEKDFKILSEDLKIDLKEVNDMEEAVKNTNANSGDIVLLSPGTSSLNQFKGFEDRGDKFVQAVKNL